VFFCRFSGYICSLCMLISSHVLLASSILLFVYEQHNVIWWRVGKVYLHSLIMDFSPVSSYLSIFFGPVTFLTTCRQTPSLYALRFQEEMPLFTYDRRSNYGFPTVNAPISFLLLPCGRVRQFFLNYDLSRSHWPSPGLRLIEHGILGKWYFPRNSRSTKQRTCPNATLSCSDITCTVLWKNPDLCRENLLYDRAVDTQVISNENLHYVSV
jgi:hypothetical protein